MSDIKNFISSTRHSTPRGAAYLIDSGQRSRRHGSSDTAEGRPPGTKAPGPMAGAAPYAEQIRLVLTGYHRFIGKMPSRASVKTRVDVLVSFYRELKARGFDIQDVSSFALRHAKALLEIWHSKGCAPNTVYVRWSVLRAWSQALGKHAMLGPLTQYLPGFVRQAPPRSGNRAFTTHEVSRRSSFLRTKPDLTPYLVDRLTRELCITREMALQLDIDALQAVVEGGAAVLRTGQGMQRKNITHIQLHRALITEARDFMVSRHRKTLAWSGLDMDAAIQKYALRMAYVSRTLFPKNAPAAPQQETGGAA